MTFTPTLRVPLRKLNFPRSTDSVLKLEWRSGSSKMINQEESFRGLSGSSFTQHAAFFADIKRKFCGPSAVPFTLRTFLNLVKSVRGGLCLRGCIIKISSVGVYIMVTSEHNPGVNMCEGDVLNLSLRFNSHFTI